MAAKLLSAQFQFRLQLSVGAGDMLQFLLHVGNKPAGFILMPAQSLLAGVDFALQTVHGPAARRGPPTQQKTGNPHDDSNN